MLAEPVSHPAAIRVDLGAIFVSLELSKSTWLVTSLSPGIEKMSRHSVPGGDMPALFACLDALRDKAEAREGQRYPVIAIQEAGLDGFWIHSADADIQINTAKDLDARRLLARHISKRGSGFPVIFQDQATHTARLGQPGKVNGVDAARNAVGSAMRMHINYSGKQFV